MKKLLFTAFLVFALAFISKVSFSQTLYFCESVDNDGRPVGESTTFNIPSGGGYFYFLVRLPYEVQCNSVSYELYKVGRNGGETYNTTIYQDDMSLTWVWFWKKVTFYETGSYHIYVKDCYGSTLCSEYLKINWQ